MAVSTDKGTCDETIFFKGRSFTAVFIFVPSWYALFALQNVIVLKEYLISKNDGWVWGGGRAPSTVS